MKTLLIVCAAALAGCAAKPSAPVDQVAKEAAEHQALVAAMKQHPSLQEGQNGSATGQPISVPTTVPPRPSGSEDGHTHGHPPPQPDPRAHAP